MSALNQYQFQPPQNYYQQPPLTQTSTDDDAPMSPDDHLALLGAQLGGDATIQSTGGQHLLAVHHYGDGTSWLQWQGRRRSSIHHSGEIHMVSSAQKGAASAIHDTARAIARDAPEVAVPKHSRDRTLEGSWWVDKEQRRHGEQLWGNPNLAGSPAYMAWQQFQGYLSENDDDVDRSDW